MSKFVLFLGLIFLGSIILSGAVSAVSQGLSHNTIVPSNNLTVSHMGTINSHTKIQSTSHTKTNKTTNSLNTKNKQTLPDPQIWRDGAPVDRGHGQGYNYPTIADAIADATDGDTIMLEDGATFYEHDLTIDKNLDFKVFNNGHATIDGQNHGVFINSGYTINIQNLIITNGANYEGGAIYNQGTCTVTGCTFNSNTANTNGGAILNYYGSTLSVTGCTFTNNSAGLNGGAIYNQLGALTVNSCTFTNNTASSGGAIYNPGGTCTVTGCNFTSNTAINGVGGAIYNDGTCTVTGSSIFTGNSATDQGGAIYNYGTCTVTGSSIFTGNRAIVLGGAIMNTGALAVTGSTFNSNTATNYGGAIYNYGGTAYVHFNRIVGNTATYQGSAIYHNTGTVDASLNWWGSNNGPSTGDVYGSVTVNPWLVLNVVANLTLIKNGGTSTITADLKHDNTNTLQTGGYVPDGIPVSFITTLGIMGIPSSMIDGVSQATLYSGTFSGLATVTVRIDDQPVETLVTIDTISPVMSSIDPVNNPKINVVNKVITVTFSEPILVGSAYDSISVTGPSGIVKMTKNIIGNVLTLTPTSNYPDGNYNINIPVNSVTDLANNGLATTSISSFTIDIVPPIVGVSLNNGLYNTNKAITLLMSEPGTIYYTLNGVNPTTTSTRYTGPITVSSSKILKFLAVDLAGNKSPIYTKIYTIDKIAPKVVLTSPKNGAIKVSRTATILIKFSEKFKSSVYWSKIMVQNKYGKAVRITKTIIGNTFKIKTTKRIANSLYIVTIPRAAIKDYTSNNLKATYSFKFKTGK